MSTFEEYVYFVAWVIECYAVHLMDFRLSPIVREELLSARA